MTNANQHKAPTEAATEIFSENQEWFEKLSPEERAEFLEAERQRSQAIRDSGIEPLGPTNFDS